ncbi:MAG: DUF99 family protein [Sulfolobales archaeon]|nr:DUF99 family protein [Sulfolobales archaeon]MDW8010332.1 DUF99 family protein [Sulfolobales archaeon]
MVGIDDGFFPPSFKELKLSTFLVGTLYQGKLPKDVKVKLVTVDGTDGTERAVEILRELGGADVVFLDGVTVAGFNTIDPDSLLQFSKLVVVIYKFEPSIEKIEKALKSHFTDWGSRLGVILKAYSRSNLIETRWKTMRVALFGELEIDVAKLISSVQLVSSMPEPLRISDVVASALSRNSVLLNSASRKRSSSYI